MNKILLCVFIAVSVIHLIAAFFEIEKLRKITKLLLVPLLLAYFIAARGSLFTPVLMAALLALLGDFFLLEPQKPIFFTLGLSSFLLGHLCYIFAFIVFTETFHIPMLIISYIIAIALEVVIMKTVKPDKSMIIPAALYTFIILSMSGFALQLMRSNPTIWTILIFMGSLLFICSDTLLAFFTFRKMPKRGNFYVMLFYIAAQAFIMIGLSRL